MVKKMSLLFLLFLLFGCQKQVNKNIVGSYNSVTDFSAIYSGRIFQVSFHSDGTFFANTLDPYYGGYEKLGDTCYKLFIDEEEYTIFLNDNNISIPIIIDEDICIIEFEKYSHVPFIVEEPDHINEK